MAGSSEGGNGANNAMKGGKSCVAEQGEGKGSLRRVSGQAGEGYSGGKSKEDDVCFQEKGDDGKRKRCGGRREG